MSAVAKLSAALGLGEDAASVLAVLGALYAEIDAEVGACAEGMALPCKAGCDACCHESVFLSAPEFLAVADYLMRTRSVEERRAIVQAMSSIAARYEDEIEMLELIEGDERDEVAARVKFRCPLLGADGLCTVYAARELNARTFGLTLDRGRGHPYGCELTHARLRVLGDECTSKLFDAREARRRLLARVPGAGSFVHVYPWWFRRFGCELL